MHTRSQGWVRRFGIGLALAAIVGAAVAAQVDASTSAAPPAPGAGGHRSPHIMPFGQNPPALGPRGSVPGKVAVGNLPTLGTAPSGAHLTYYGGRVVSNVQVVQVIWGAGSYLPQTTSTSTPSMSSFFGGITNSAYFDWLTEYNTPATGGTNQIIGRGTFGGQVTITPSVNGATIDDTQIVAELSAQIQGGHVPAPTHDAHGNNTLYALFFRNGQTITQGGSSSLVAGGFCAYHGTIGNVPGAGEVYYSVLPDLAGITGCGTGNDFQNTTSVMSHEMIETVTDPEVGLATNTAAPLAWYDNTNGEIGDICNAQQGPVTGGDAQTYTVQYEFSNLSNDCILSRAVASAFSLSATPSMVSVAAGSSTSSTISTSTTAGSAQTVTLSVSGAPAGVTTSLAPASVTSGQSATLNVATNSSATPGTYTLTVTGTAVSGVHSTSVILTVTGATPPPTGITNGGFETGTLTGWTSNGSSETVASSGCHGGTFCAQLGGTGPTNGDSTITQTFTAPAGSTGISLWYKETCPDTVTYDWALATLKDNTVGTTATLIAKTCATNAWTTVSSNLVPQHSYTLTLISHDDNYAGDPTFTLYDDVSFATSTPPAGGITNGGFETGTLAGWTASGASDTVVTSGCHSGTACARLGSTSATNGDSSIVQTFTAPAGTTSLSIWYKMTCPDTLTYDWATATLKDNTTAATATVLAKTCATNPAWTQVSASVTAGHSYTLTLTSHDDNYSADPTLTLYDDVTLK